MIDEKKLVEEVKSQELHKEFATEAVKNFMGYKIFNIPMKYYFLVSLVGTFLYRILRIEYYKK